MTRVFFLGQKPVGERAFELLLQAECTDLQVVGVCSNSKSDDVWWGSNGIARKVDQSSHRTFLSNEIKSERGLLDGIQRTGANLILSIQHPNILSKQVLEAVKHRAFNLHNAKLPHYRGNNAVNHALLNRETDFTVTLHWMSAEVDRGDIAFEECFMIEPRETALSLYVRAARAGIRVFQKFLACLLSGTPVPRKPQESEGNYYPRSSIDGLNEIKNPADSEELDLKSRALCFPPFEPAYFLRDGRRFYVLPKCAEPGRFPPINWDGSN